MSDGISVSGDEIRIRTKDYLLRHFKKARGLESLLDQPIATKNEFLDLVAWCRTAQNGTAIPEKWMHVWKLRRHEVLAALRRERDMDLVSLGVLAEVRAQQEDESNEHSVAGGLSIDQRIAACQRVNALIAKGDESFERAARRCPRGPLASLQCFATAACPRG